MLRVWGICIQRSNFPGQPEHPMIQNINNKPRWGALSTERVVETTFWGRWETHKQRNRIFIIGSRMPGCGGPVFTSDLDLDLVLVSHFVLCSIYHRSDNQKAIGHVFCAPLQQSARDNVDNRRLQLICFVCVCNVVVASLEDPRSRFSLLWSQFIPNLYQYITRHSTKPSTLS
jgi:hypothetical protein